MEYRITLWFLAFKAITILFLVAYGAWHVFTGIGKGIGLDGIAYAIWGLLVLTVGLFIANITVISVGIAGKHATLTNLLLRKETVAVKRLIFGGAFPHGFVSLRINEGWGKRDLEIMFFRDWKSLALDLEKETGVAIPNKQEFLRY